LDYSLISFFSVKGAHTILPTCFSFFSFLRWWFGTNWQALEKCCGSAIMDLRHAAIRLGIGHKTGWTVGDQVRQVAPPSQQANLYIICQDDVISKKYCCFWIP